MTAIDVIMSVYNETPNELKLAIESIFSQTFSDFKFIIVNDNPQNTALDLQVRSIVLKDERVIYHKNESNLGLARSLNIAASLSNSMYISRMDADDISVDSRLAREKYFLDSHNDIDVVSTNIEYIDEENNSIGFKSSIPVNDKKIKRFMNVGLTVIHPSTMVRRSAFEDLGGYNNLETAEDLDLWLRFRMNERKFAAIDEPLLKYRLRQNSMTSNTWRNYLYTKAIRKHSRKCRTSNSSDKCAINIKNDVYKMGLDDERKRGLFEKHCRCKENAIGAVKEGSRIRGVWLLLASAFFSLDSFKDTLEYINYRKLLKTV